MMTLQDYLTAAAHRPFAWGGFDCMLYLADWVNDQRGQDPAAPWRGHYGCAREASRIIGHYGGLEGLIDHAVRDILDPTDHPLRGDIGIVVPRGKNEPMGAILTGMGWTVLKRSGGIWCGPHPVVAAWRVG